jgi:hypothetical protein
MELGVRLFFIITGAISTLLGIAIWFGWREDRKKLKERGYSTFIEELQVELSDFLALFFLLPGLAILLPSIFVH